MKIKEIQKLTLIDYPGRLACILFLSGCNFRCGFCHNPELVLQEFWENISEEEALRFLEKRQAQLDGVCITGGEPLLSLDKYFLKQIKNLGYFIKIDTNGSFPDKLKELVDEGLVDYVAMDIKASREKYKEVVNAEVDLEKIERSIKIISGLSNYEFRTTIVEGVHDVEGVKRIGEWLNRVVGEKPRKYFLQGFRNKGKFIDESFNEKKDTTEEMLDEIKENVKDYFEEVGVRV